jgi:methylene-fatty-acyl-phospholipid synthase
MVILWIACSREEGVCLDFSRVSLLQWLSCLLLVGYGQSLNVGIFKAIGHVGVYYGFKLGYKVPWVRGWPFDTVAHPQYVGSVLSIWGAAALLWNQMHLTSLLLVVIYWTLLYVVTGLQEQYL